jgi:hypothetical protein
MESADIPATLLFSGTSQLSFSFVVAESISSWLLNDSPSTVLKNMTIALRLNTHKERRYFTSFRTIERALGRIGQQRWLSIILVAVLALGASAALSLLGRIPEPEQHDEFSYLLAADTFAHGRLTNPTHPLWVHFESIHIIQQPTYASKYPPGQGLMLAAGQVLAGQPIVGVWISTALASAAICWMLLAWLPPWWAVLGGMLAAIHPIILIHWGQHYWGGAVAAMGGALVFGALRRLMRRPRVRDALLMAVGLAVLANSRPYEGLVVSLPVALLLFTWMAGKNGPTAHVSITRIVLPIVGVLAVTGGAMAFYNWRVTGNALRMPYQVYEATYAVTPLFVWQQRRPEPFYRHKVMRDFYIPGSVQRGTVYTGSPIHSYAEGRPHLWMFLLWSYDQLRSLPYPAILILLLGSLALLSWILRDRWSRFALLMCGVLAVGLAMESFFFLHYAAPITGMVFMLMLQSLRHLRLWRWHGPQTGRLVVWTIVMSCVVLFIIAFVLKIQDTRSAETTPRARILAQLKETSGRHLVIVRYDPVHSAYEWVYNEADIDGAKVVWAREMDAAQNRKLLEYFQDRDVWLLKVGQYHPSPKLEPYPVIRTFDSARDSKTG